MIKIQEKWTIQIFLCFFCKYYAKKQTQVIQVPIFTRLPFSSWTSTAASPRSPRRTSRSSTTGARCSSLVGSRTAHSRKKHSFLKKLFFGILKIFLNTKKIQKLKILKVPKKCPNPKLRFCLDVGLVLGLCLGEKILDLGLGLSGKIFI